MQNIIDGVYDALSKSHEPEDRIGFIRLRLFGRAFNAFKAVGLLLEHDHWEMAAPLSRQMFELLVNLEELQRSDDLDRAVERFLRFAAFQDVRMQTVGMRYDIATGRRSPDATPTPADLERFCLAAFPEFAREKRSGKMVWAHSWTGRSIRELAHLSGGIREAQYNNLYPFLSNEAHGSPFAAVGGFADLTGAREVTFDERVDSDTQQVVRMASFSSTFLLEL